MIFSKRLFVVVTTLALASCGGGGGGGAPATNVLTNNTGAGNSGGTSTGGSSGSTGGTVPTNTALIRAASDRPGVGGNPTVPPIAVNGGPKISDGAAASVGIAFPLIQEAVVINPTDKVIGQPANVVSQGATLTIRSTGVELAIPALGINVVVGDTGEVKLPGGTLNLSLVPYEYLLAGVWNFEVGNPQGGVANYTGFFTTGYRTAESAMPTFGTATYLGIGGAYGFVFVRSGANGNDFSPAQVLGDVFLTVNFSTTSITGSFTNMLAQDLDGNLTAWNSVAINGNNFFNQARHEFQGITTVTSVPNTPFALKSNATGYFYGRFYGPSVEQVAMGWSLSNQDNSGSSHGIAVADLSVAGFPSALSNGFVALLPITNWTNGNVANIPTPLAATRDVNSNPPVLATLGGTTFSVSTPSTGFNDVNFPIRLTGFQYSSSSITANANSSGAKFSLGGGDRLTLNVPSAGVVDNSLTYSVAHIPSVPGSNANQGTGNGFSTFGLNYTEFGAWSVTDTSGVQNSTGVFSLGFETPSPSMPTTGTATYTGQGTVDGTALVRSGTSVLQAAVSGDVSLTANFATGQINGAFTNMNAHTRTASTPWNDVSVTASIASGTSSFSGTTAATSNPNSTYSLKSTATGQIDGGFYGPGANEIGAVWTLSNGDGTGSAFGIVGGGR